MAQHYQCRIYVTLRPSVLDPAGTAVQSGLHQLGYEGVESVRIGKYIEVKLTADNEDQVQQQLHAMCDQLLANPVIENYCFEITPISSPVTVG
jgi:phosphoribosylformylglycinamidine synthase